MPRRETMTRTIRIDQDVDEGLRKLSDEEGVSVNSLVNRNLRKLVEWDAHAQKFGFVMVPESLFTRLIEALSEEQAAELGRWAGANLVREYITFWFKEINLDTVRKGLFELSSRYARPFEYEERIDGEYYTIVISHGGGTRGSLYYAEMIRVLLDEILHLQPKVERTENQVIVRFRDKRPVPADEAAVN